MNPRWYSIKLIDYHSGPQRCWKQLWIHGSFVNFTGDGLNTWCFGILWSIVIMDSTCRNETSLSEVERKARWFYDSCMEANSAASTSKSSLHAIIGDVGGWNLTGAPIDMSHFDMRRKVMAIQKYTTSSLFKWYYMMSKQSKAEGRVKLVNLQDHCKLSA